MDGRRFNIYNVYRIDHAFRYRGFSFVAAETAEEANKLIDEFKKDPINLYVADGYLHVQESNKIGFLFSDEKGIVLEKIYYDERERF